MSKKVKIYHPVHGENKCYPQEIANYKKDGWDISKPKPKRTKKSLKKDPDKPLD